VPLDDPTELFDLYDESGRPLGVTKPRARVHEDGDWHRSVHLWVVLMAAAGPLILLQRRSLTKDSHPGAVDVSVAGHLRAGETYAAGVREAVEEIGLVVEPGDLVRLGTRRNVARRGADYLDRELQEVFFVCSPASLEQLRPDTHEVAGVLAVALPDAQALFDGEVGEVTARELRAHDHTVNVTLRRGELLQGGDDYFALALRAITRSLAGGSLGPWPLGPP